MTAVQLCYCDHCIEVDNSLRLDIGHCYMVIANHLSKMIRCCTCRTK